MVLPLTGHCLCGETTFVVNAEAITVGHDHCDDCQRQSGSSYSFVVIVPFEDFKVEGPVKRYSKAGDSGQLVHRLFCGNCGSPIAHHPESAAEIIAIKGGVLDVKQKRTLHERAEIDIYGKDMLPGVPRLRHYNELMP